jgi:hypothetical protein
VATASLVVELIWFSETGLAPLLSLCYVHFVYSEIRFIIC